MRILPVFALLLVLAMARDAAAFCRTTTCRGADCTRDADGCPKDGVPVFWKTRCVGISLQKNLTQNLDPVETRKTIVAAFQTWSDLDCGGRPATMTFSILDDVACRTSEYRAHGPNVNVVFFQDDDWQYKDVDNTLAKTTLSFDVNTGEIFDADIEVNTSANKVTVGTQGTTYDLQSILTHEIGHLIGLAHSPKGSATMFASYEPGTTDLRSLDPDDVAAACAAYPPDREAMCDPEPRGGVADACDVRVLQPGESGCNGAGAPPSLGLLAAWLLTAWLRWRRRRACPNPAKIPASAWLHPPTPRR